jgi:iron(III) transport system permease protein
MFVNQAVIGKRKSYTTVTGKSANISQFKLKKFRTPISSLFLVLVLCVSVIPMISFLLQSMIKIQGNYSPSNFTLDFWIGAAATSDKINDKAGILINADVWKGLFNSLKLSVVAALGAGTFGFLAGYAIVKQRGTWLSRFVENLTFIPYLIPSMAFSVIYLSMFAVRHGPIPALYGSFAILAIIGTVKYLPMASRSGVNSMLQLSHEIEEAAMIVGVPWWKRMTQIIVPIQKSTVISGYLLPFISSMRELSLYVLLVTPANKVLTTILFQYNEKGWDQYANAINFVIIVFVLVINFGIEKLTGASIEKGVGG